jgi:general secretion pathway protein D
MSIRLAGKRAFWLVVPLLLAGCQSAHRTDLPTPAAPPVTQQSDDATTAATVLADANKSAASPDQPNAEIYPGSGGMLGKPLPKRERKVETTVSPQGDITLNFINADVKDVAKAILGDYLKLNYEIGSGVQGTVTIQTSQPLARSKVLPILDQTLRLSGVALVFQNNIYKLVAAADAPHEAGAISMGASASTTPGYGIEVAPVHYISATEMQKLLEPLAPSQAIVHVDTARNVLIIEGTQEERQALLADIALFDADWLSGMSFALYTPNYMDAGELTKELTQILGGLESPIGTIVKLVPIERLNAVLAISPQVKYLDQLKAWVARLDRPGQGSDKHIFVYHVQHGRASDLAGTLAQALFGHSGSGAGMQSHSSPPPPDILSAPGQGGSSTPTAPAAPAAAAPASSPASATSQFSGTLPGESQSALGPVNITSDEANNALVIVASPQQYAAIQNALAQLDTAPLQVLLEAAIAEVTLTNNISYGVQYYFAPGAQNSFTLSDTTSGSITPTFPGFSYAFSGGNIKIILDALSSITKVDVLSSPQLMVLNNQTATLQVGDQVPIITEQAVGVQSPGAPVVNSVEYENTGVILQVTPRVNRGGEVMMDITQEVSDVSTTDISSTGSPVIEQRKITSSVAVQDGETVTLGGLISNQNNTSKTGVPYLDEIPYIGNAFRDTSTGFTRTELLVLITPHVVDNVQKARAVTAELRRKLPMVQSLLEKPRRSEYVR